MFTVYLIGQDKLEPIDFSDTYEAVLHELLLSWNEEPEGNQAFIIRQDGDDRVFATIIRASYDPETAIVMTEDGIRMFKCVYFVEDNRCWKTQITEVN